MQSCVIEDEATLTLFNSHSVDFCVFLPWNCNLIQESVVETVEVIRQFEAYGDSKAFFLQCMPH